MSGPAAAPTVLRAVREHAGLSPWDLWLSYFALGGTASIRHLEAHVQGQKELDDLQHDIVVQALNERFDDMDLDHTVPFVRAGTGS